ncbi:VOC family protein [Vibrio sp. SM6]|uniref:VOC family protein n=1 Tax=Vibrio agarilyticus TaxID=2726741 RepID=A0A7X8TTT8_9VIBR|nr:VOC family protein [Vibrio agarilyticus]NLS14691.1 VOC family protein [Vibrio agarilyticus]
MFQMTPYLFFSGRGRAALDFYQTCFGGEITSIQYYRDAPQVIPGVDPNWVMHAEFEAFGLKLMMSDGLAQKARQGNTVSLALSLTDLDLQTRLFDRLSKGGYVMVPLADTALGARFGKVEDKFGIRWMLHCERVR